MSDWCTIESDPGVFTSLIESFGVQNAQLTELWSMDDDSLSNLVHEYNKVYGLIFLFKWQNQPQQQNQSNNQNDSSRKPLSLDETPDDLFFARQVTTNACATQAILSILLNAPTTTPTTTNQEENNPDVSKIVLGPTLEGLKSFTSTFPPDIKGEAIGASDEIRNAHNSFARKEAFLIDHSQKRMATDDDDVFHFIAYVPHDNQVYELDGLQPGPIPSGDIITSTSTTSTNTTDLAWLQVARDTIQTRIEKYASTEIKFNLMALTADKRIGIQHKLKSLLDAGINDGDESMTHLQMELAGEEEKRQLWQQENERRRHNYLPFCMELIKAIAASGKLPEYTDKANERMIDLRKKMRNKQNGKV